MARPTVWALLVVLLTGCQMEGDVAVTVDGDGGGTLAVTLAVDEELRQAAVDAGADPLAVLAEAGDGLADWRVARAAGGAQPTGASDDDPGGGDAVTLSTRFRDAADLERVTRGFAEGLAGPELAPLGPMRLTVTESTLELTGSADLRVSAAVRELSLSRRRARDRMTENLRFRITARMPGAIVDTNADERPDDHTAVWTIAPGEQRVLQVTAERPWTLARILGAVIHPAGVAAAVIGTALIVAWHRTTRADPTLPLRTHLTPPLRTHLTPP